MKKWTLLLLLLALTLTGCSAQPAAQPAEKTKIGFSDAIQLSDIEKLDGKTIEIIGYMATLSPINGKYLYLMNLPYQSCPFCVPNSTQLANTMAVYAPDGQTFTYTDQAVRITGRMELGDFTDDYGYVYNYRIVDAVSEIVDLAQVSDEYALWQSIAADGIVGDVNQMLDYVYFACQWTQYEATSEMENGETQTYNLYPGDAEQYLEDDGPYGYAAYGAQDYFPGLISRVRAISPDKLEDLVSLIEEAQSLCAFGLAELSAQHYTYDEALDQYVLDADEEIVTRYDALYEKFSQWLAQWEL